MNPLQKLAAWLNPAPPPEAPAEKFREAYGTTVDDDEDHLFIAERAIEASAEMLKRSNEAIDSVLEALRS